LIQNPLPIKQRYKLRKMIGAESTPLEVEKWGPSIFAPIIFGLSTEVCIWFY